MAEKNCQACADLQADSPNLIVNGIGTTEVSSLMNNTGLNPASGNDDCTDLNNMNDCLIGNLEDEVDAFDVCDWKSFTKNFVNNTWTVLKGIISAICGLWANIKSLLTLVNALSTRVGELCELVNASIAPNGQQYGVFPRNPGITAAGQIVNKNSRPALIDAEETSSGADRFTGVGFRFARINAFDCSTGADISRSYYKPYIWGYKLNKDVEDGDALWVITKSQFLSITGYGEDWWTTYTNQSWTWTEHRIVRGADKGKNVWLRWKVGDAGYSTNYLVMTYVGTSYPSETPSYDALIQEGATEEVRWGY